MTILDHNTSLSELSARAASIFQDRFGRPARWVAAAPGRVNLIGDHTDYNHGFVLPMAIDRYVVIAGDLADANGPGQITTIYSSLVDQQQAIALSGASTDALPDTALPIWAKYIRGTILTMAEEGLGPHGFDAAVESNVPLGAGVSSSAALEVATATLIEAISEAEVDPVAKALRCQQAEHEAVGVPCGIMDQFSSTLCQADHLMLLDCQNQQFDMIPMTDPDITVLVTNSNVKHELAGGAYAERRSQCESAAEALGVASLRDATPELLEGAKGCLDATRHRRARHVNSEIERTAQTARAIRRNDWQRVGEFMAASHASLRDDFEVSCKELDILVELAHDLVPQGVIGSRMTGGGFGGCTITLVRTDTVLESAQSLAARYREKTGIEASLFTTRPSQGAQTLQAETAIGN